MTMKWEDTKYKNPMARARGLGAAGDGVGHWFHQRITAIANIPLVLWFVCSIVRMHGATHAEFTAFLGQPVNAILMILFVISIFYHAALGAQVITEDYIHHEGLKMLKLIGIKLFFIGTAVACIFSVLKIAFGA